VEPVGGALTSNAAQVAGLGRIYFGLHSRYGFSRIDTDRHGSGRVRRNERRTNLLLIIRFLFSYTYAARMRPKKSVVPGFPKTALGVHKHLAASIAFAPR
jgi:hypothetical protein